MKSVAVVEPNVLELIEIPKPVPGPYEALIRTEAACLCNATDRKLIEGHFPGVDKYPLLLGHETVGIVEEVGSHVITFKPGDRVVGGLLFNTGKPELYSGWGGFSEYILACDHLAMVKDGIADEEHQWFEVYEIMRAVPLDVSIQDAVLLCTWREVYGGFGDFQLKPGDDIVIFGAGPVGLSFVKFARLIGLGTIVSVDKLPEKRTKALAMGADAAFEPNSAEFEAYVRARGKSFDALIDAVGREEIINASLPLVKMGGSICVYGVIDTPSIQLHKHNGPYNFNLIIHQWPTRALEAAAQEPLIEWIRAGKLSYRDFITDEYPISEIAAAYEQSKTGLPIKTLLRF
jgi:2-desacetyl-2-hydroxyethyl bacteriochlorophyllide A dehydrogenase